MIDNIGLREILPHRYPFLLVDKILEVEPGKKAVGIKNVTANEPFFQGHFPGKPIMPGVLILEALAQTACVAGLLLEGCENKLGLFTGVESLKYRRQVVPGDVLRLEIEFLTFRHYMGRVQVKATVENEVACEGFIKFAMIDP